MTVLCYVAPYSLADVYWRFRGASAPSSGSFIVPLMEAGKTSETSVYCQTIWRYIPEDILIFADMRTWNLTQFSWFPMHLSHLTTRFLCVSSAKNLPAACFNKPLHKNVSVTPTSVVRAGNKWCVVRFARWKRKIDEREHLICGCCRLLMHIAGMLQNAKREAIFEFAPNGWFQLVA
jgi:hypothetical protein